MDLKTQHINFDRKLISPKLYLEITHIPELYTHEQVTLSLFKNRKEYCITKTVTQSGTDFLTDLFSKDAQNIVC